MFSHRHSEDSSTVGMLADRRAGAQPPNRQSGMVTTISGSRAVVATKFPTILKPEDPYWAIGNLVTIYGPRSRIICLVQDMSMTGASWNADEENDARANVEMLGEITDEADGKPSFRRGIMNYPPLGAPVHRIRSDDLSSMYDLKERKASVIGSLVMDETVPAAINIEGMLKKHFAVVGTTGVGKSSGVSIMLRAAVADRPKLRIIILDPHNEYSQVFKDIAVTVDARSFELPFWLFRFEEIIEVVFRGAKPESDEIDFLRDAIIVAKELYDGTGGAQPGSILKKTLRTEGASVTADAPQPYRIADILALIDDALGRLEQKYEKSALKSLRARLESLNNDPNYKFMFGTAAIDGASDPIIRQLFRLHDSSRPITVLQLAGIPSDVVNASVSVLSRMAFELSMASQGRNEILLMCEEAHRYVPAGVNSQFTPARRSIARIAKEGRKYGCYLGIVTQRPSELDPTILSQCSSVFAMRLANAEDQNIIRSAIPDAATGVLDFISALSNREAIAFGEAVATPMRMLFSQLAVTDLPKTLENDVGIVPGGFERTAAFPPMAEPRTAAPSPMATGSADAFGAPLSARPEARAMPVYEAPPQRSPGGPGLPSREELRELLRRPAPSASPGAAGTESWPTSNPGGGFGRR